MAAILSRLQCANMLVWKDNNPNDDHLSLVLTHWGRDEMDAITQTTFSSAFFWKKMFEFQQ